MLNHEFFPYKVRFSWNAQKSVPKLCFSPPEFSSFFFVFLCLANIYVNWGSLTLGRSWWGRSLPAASYSSLSGRRIILCKETDQNCASSLYKVQITFSKIAKLVWLCVAATINVCMVKWAVWSATGMASRPMNRPTSTFSSSKLNF